MKLLFFILSILFLHIYGQEGSRFFVKNLLIATTKDSFEVVSRTKFGYSIFGVPSSNSSTFNTTKLYIVWIPTDAPMQVRRVVSSSDFTITKKLNIISDDDLAARVDDVGPKPFAGTLDLLIFSLIFDNNLANNSAGFQTPFYFYCAAKLNGLPSLNGDEMIIDNNLDQSGWVTITAHSNTSMAYKEPRARLEPLHPAPFAITLFYYLVVFILLIIFARFEPLKSRSILPFIATIVQFFYLLSDFFAFGFTLEDWHKGYCYVWFFIQQPLIYCIISLSLIQFARYLILLVFQSFKNKIIEVKNTSTASGLKIMLKIFKFTNNPIIYLLYIFIIYLIFAIIFLILLIVNNYDCVNTNIFVEIELYFSIAIIVLYIILGIVDLVLCIPRFIILLLEYQC